MSGSLDVAPAARLYSQLQLYEPVMCARSRHDELLAVTTTGAAIGGTLRPMVPPD